MDSLSLKSTDIATAVRVLRAVGSATTEQLMDSSLKGLRRASLDLAKAAAQRMPKHVKAAYGLAEHDPAAVEKYRQEQWRKSQRRRDIDLDKKYTNSTTLRSGRIANLKRLEEEQEDGSLLPLIPDGVATPMSRLALPGSSAQTAEGAGTTEAAAPGAPTGASAAAALAAAPLAASAHHAHVNRPKACYTCKRRFRDMHAFYDRLCPLCAKLNFAKRNLQVDLTGRTFLVTGCRVKIGFQVSLKLLRNGAQVIGTSRFPRDAALRFHAEADQDSWAGRLHLYGLDFRSIPSVEAFAGHIIATHAELNGIVNNACQTVRRPAKYYETLARGEREGVGGNMLALAAADAWAKAGGRTRGGLSNRVAGSSDGGGGGGSRDSGEEDALLMRSPEQNLGALSAELSQAVLLPEDAVRRDEDLPADRVDVNGQQLDLRTKNSWIMRLHEIQTPELVEVLAINTVAPFVLNARLKPLLERSRFPDRYVVNVSAMEGKFYRHKGPEHPHTNMAKAALNMMTRTSAQDYRRTGIYMNSVDTGWINDENPLEKANKLAKDWDFQTPLDEIDAAARVVDPILDGVERVRAGQGEPEWGKFLKDFAATEW